MLYKEKSLSSWNLSTICWDSLQKSLILNSDLPPTCLLSKRGSFLPTWISLLSVFAMQSRCKSFETILNRQEN
ncbi:hypothetical protein ERIC1_1c05100 [Paenibacillus larvae subsp. larvae DSM 25719]|uniref:Uncharacterized protein n=1 Tax=Paenibacillus larvae subsp. larvae DSM 25430 TaxID=697284 RepID=V9W6G9_9BACL|nr:hypothetical protein ERIC2_c17220 [Paenibacillus larvae subsp. larvae DSM 25430]ETK27070.1 hypothetical protein ERIC1_1c05100 [Paenibacillus larvae subsp. larvae DSM 25719]